MTYSQVIALVDAEKLKRYNDMYFNVIDIVSEMDEDGVRDALNNVNSSKGVQRGKLIQKMMVPYSPSFLLPDWQEKRELERARPIEGLEPRVAEGIMQAIERRVVTHQQWLSIHPIWDRILATANQLGRTIR